MINEKVFIEVVKYLNDNKLSRQIADNIDKTCLNKELAKEIKASIITSVYLELMKKHPELF